MTPSRRVPPPFDRPHPVVGMVHLRPLPGAPRFEGSVDAVIDRAVADALALAEGGVHGVMIENYGDVPFFPGAVPPVTVAAMTRAVVAVAEALRSAGTPPGSGPGEVRLGVNVLRNDARSALGIAAAIGAHLIRVNVHTGGMHTDQGPLTGRAADTLRTRAALPGRPAILADVFVKHATPPAGARIEDAARDLVERGLADGVIVSGSGTGRDTPLEVLRVVRDALPDASLWIGSGARAETVAELGALADGFIVGSALKVGGRVDAPVDSDRVRTFVTAVDSL